MKLIDNQLYLEFSEAVKCGISADAIKKAKQRNSSSWNIIKDPADRRSLLIGFDQLMDEYKKMVEAQYGDPHEYIAKQPIKDLVKKDYKAEEFYRNRLMELKADHSKLPGYVAQYTTAASWLNMLLKLEEDKQYIKKTLRLKMDAFWKNVIAIIKADDIDLPVSTRFLFPKMKKYKEEGYECLIDWRFGNKNTAKIGKTEKGFDQELHDKQVAIIREASRKHQNFDAAQICRAVNLLFKKHNWPTISHTTVFNLVRQERHLTTAGSRGKRVHESTISMQVKRKAPEFPLLFCTLDGWTVELLYQDERGYNNRLVVVIVLDPCQKYPIGYAIGERENAELIRQANRNAIIHIQQLFGNTYRPLQLQSDRYGLKNLTPFYQAVAHLHTPAAVGNAKAKVIEPYFNYLNEKYFQAFKNWSGHNVTSSKKNQPNVEFLDKIKTTFPDKAGAIHQIEMVLHQERLVKLADYRRKWEATPEDAKKVLSKMDLLMVFGQQHVHPKTKLPETNSITGQGIVCTLLGRELTYDSFDPSFRALHSLKWQLYYDANDLSEVLAISTDGKNRFVLQEKRIVPMDLYSMQPEDHQYLKRIRDFNRDRKEEIIQTYLSDDAIVQEVLENTPLALDDYNEAALKLMFTTNGQQKEAIQDAKGLRKVQQKQERQKAIAEVSQDKEWHNLQMQYLQSKTDFNQYLD